MDKPQWSVEDGILKVKAHYAHDGDSDGRHSAKAGLEVELDLYEVITEVAKKDVPWLEALLAQLKV